MRFLIVIAIACVIAVAAQASPKPHQALRAKVAEHRAATWYWQDVAFRRQTPSAFHEHKTKSARYLRWLARKWYDRRIAAMRHAQNPPHLQAWLCIHRYEGAWNDPNAPYYGGLQMDMQFQRTYGWNLLQQKGTADNWTMWEQIWVAEKARASGRGWYPWPNTARYCGLI
jgi:hypothetical protein